MTTPMSTNSTKRELWIFTDWDETITAHDTLAFIAPPDSTKENAPPPLSYFGKYYMDLMTAHEKAFGPRTTLERQLAYLESLTPVEAASVKEVEEKGLFKGVLEEDIQRRAQQVEFRDGWKDFTEEVRRKEHVRLMGILSVNWSKVFIEAALRRIHDDAFMNEFEIRANVPPRQPAFLMVECCDG
jgi:thiamine phosphate phosphatase / amino-HMP aminohydrolase